MSIFADPLTDRNKTSSTLLESLRAQEDQGWQRFVDLYGTTLYRWCRSARLNDEDSADVIQEVYRSVARGIARFERESGQTGSFTAWLWTVTQSKINNHRQKVSGREFGAGGSDAQQLMKEVADPFAAGIDTQSIANDESIVLSAAETIRSEFKETTWQAFWRVVIDEQPTDVVGEQLGISVAAVRQANYRVRRRLRQELQFIPQIGNTEG